MPASLPSDLFTSRRNGPFTSSESAEHRRVPDWFVHVHPHEPAEQYAVTDLLTSERHLNDGFAESVSRSEHPDAIRHDVCLRMRRAGNSRAGKQKADL